MVGIHMETNHKTFPLKIILLFWIKLIMIESLKPPWIIALIVIEVLSLLLTHLRYNRVHTFFARIESINFQVFITRELVIFKHEGILFIYDYCCDSIYFLNYPERREIYNILIWVSFILTLKLNINVILFDFSIRFEI